MSGSKGFTGRTIRRTLPARILLCAVAVAGMAAATQRPAASAPAAAPTLVRPVGPLGSGWYHARPAGARVAASPPGQLKPWGDVPHSASTERIRPWDGSAGGSTGDAVSSNWAGVVAAGQATFNSITASWVVPSVLPSSHDEASSTWIGIDGAGNQDLIQAGTEQDSGPGGPLYYAWYEVLPAPSIPLGMVSPGDRISVNISEVSPGTWTITISDSSSGGSSSGDLAYGGPGASAEWIEEAPSSLAGVIATLADFGSVEFDHPMTTGVGSSAALYAVSMSNSSGSVIAYPTAFTPTSFDVDYGSPGATGAPPGANPSPAPAPEPPGSPAVPVTGSASTVPTGYWLAGADGGVFSFGRHVYFGSTAKMRLRGPVIAMAPSSDRRGYYLLDNDGGVFNFGDAVYRGSAAGRLSRAVAMAVTPDGRGYWIADAAGRVMAFGDAPPYGRAPGSLPQPVIGMARTASGHGYWLVTRDGRVFSFGDAQSYGAPSRGTIVGSIVGMASTPTGRGYWLVAADGGVFAFGDAHFYGSTAGVGLRQPIAGVAATSDGHGYWLVGGSGGVFSFGDAGYMGSAGTVPLATPIEGVAS